MTVMDVMARDADHDTGRSCRTPVGDTRTDGTRTGLCAHANRVRRTVQRARTLARHLQIATEIVPGRRRTLDERLESWKRGDHARGWCAVYTLHETLRTDLPVDNPPATNLHRQRNVTPPRRGKAFTPTSSGSVVTTAANMQDRRATRDPAKKRRGKRAAAFDRRALVLANRCIEHTDMPAWIRRHGVKAWAAVLTPAAAHGWDVADVLAAIEDYALARRLVSNPRNPFGYLAMILATCDLAAPPAAHIKAQAAAEAAALRAEQDRLRAEIRHRNTAAAPPGNPGHLAAMATAKAAQARAERKRAERTRAERAAP